ncbi:hypothetical protein ACRAWF_04330 [Streptomyces sp. L7]
MLHNAGDLHRAKVRIAAHKDPWLKGWTRLTDNPHSASTLAAPPAVRRGPRRHGPELRHPLQRHPRRLPERPALADRRHQGQRRHGRRRPQRPGRPPSLRSTATPTASWPPASTATSSRTPPNSSATTRTSSSPASRRCCARCSCR